MEYLCTGADLFQLTVTDFIIKAGLRCGPPRRLPRATTCEGSYGVTGIIGNMVLVRSFFPHAKEFLRKFPQFGHVTSKIFARIFLGRKTFYQTYWFMGTPTYLGLALFIIIIIIPRQAD
jgi:hypothetical protein